MVVVVVGAIVVVVGAVVLVLVVVVDASAELPVSTAIVAEVASGAVGDWSVAGTDGLLAVLDDPGALMPSAESERAPLQPATTADATTSRTADVRTDRT